MAGRRREIVVATRVVEDIVVTVPQGMVKVQAAARRLNARLCHERGTQTALLEELFHAFLCNDGVINRTHAVGRPADQLKLTGPEFAVEALDVDSALLQLAVQVAQIRLSVRQRQTAEDVWAIEHEFTG